MSLKTKIISQGWVKVILTVFKLIFSDIRKQDVCLFYIFYLSRFFCFSDTFFKAKNDKYSIKIETLYRNC